MPVFEMGQTIIFRQEGLKTLSQVRYEEEQISTFNFYVEGLLVGAAVSIITAGLGIMGELVYKNTDIAYGSYVLAGLLIVGLRLSWHPRKPLREAGEREVKFAAAFNECTEVAANCRFFSGILVLAAMALAAAIWLH